MFLAVTSLLLLFAALRLLPDLLASPPAAAAEDPQEQIRAIVQATLSAFNAEAAAAETRAAAALPLLPSASPTAAPAPTSTPAPTAAHTPLPSPTPTAVPLPAYVALTGIRGQVETRNNCGPATLAMALSYWGWQGDQTLPQAVLRPNRAVDDKNVMPAELAAYVHGYTTLKTLIRPAGDLPTLQRLIAAGFPVMVEKGHITTGWIGHYVLLTGYDDANRRFLTHDSLVVSPHHPLPYADLLELWWRHFNYTFIVVYPPERETELLDLLGPHADPLHSYLLAAQRAQAEIETAQGRELFFAWYNLGASLLALGEVEGAVQAFDAAYHDIFPPLRGDQRPWRALWYETSPYQAYYAAGRYDEVIRLADATLQATGSPVLEETFYWRGKARAALGDLDAAVQDYRQARSLNPNSTAAAEELQRLGYE